MKTFTRVILPVVLVAGVVFGLTFIMMHSPEDESGGPKEAKGRKGVSASGPPLKFFTLLASTAREEPTPAGTMRLTGPAHLKHWSSDVEVGGLGEYGYWCQNRHEQPVTVRVPRTSCQCAAVELAVVPHDALAEYTVASALAGGPLCPAPGPAGALAHLAFSRKLNWELLHSHGAQHEQTIPPAAGSDRPQFAIVRLSWTGKEPIGSKKHDAHVYFNLPDAPPSYQQLEADISVVPAFYPIRRMGPASWAPVTDLPVGDLTENASSTQEFFLASSIRPDMVFTISTEPPDPCVTFTSAVPATPEEWASLGEAARQIPKDDDAGRMRLRLPKILYKVRVTVRERCEVPGTKEVHHLDLGPLERRLTITAVNGGSVPLALRGRVHGEVGIRTGSQDGRIDLGNSFSAAEDRSKDVVLVADRPGLDLSLLTEETRPNYLKVRLEPLEPVGGKKLWRLRVTVPKGTLYGALPEGSGVMLRTEGTTPRRFRLPVRGMTYDSGGPKL